MTMPAMLVCLFFLILGTSSSLQAQQVSELAVIPTYQVNAAGDSKVPFSLQSESDAYQTTRMEIQANYSGTLPDQDTEANATLVFKYRYIKLVQSHLEKGASVATAINAGYLDLAILTTDVWPGLVKEEWRQEMLTLLSI